MKRMLRYLKPYWRSLLFACCAALVSSVCNLLLPSIMSDILNNGVYRQDMDYILLCCGKMLFVALSGMAATLLGSWLSCRVVERFCGDLRTDIFRKVNTMTFEEFGQIGAAALVTRATHDVQTVSWIAGELSNSVFTIPTLFFGGVAMAMAKDVTLALTLLAFVPVILLVVVRVGKNVVPLWVKSDEYIDRQNDLMRQRLRGIRVIRAFNAEPKEQERIADATRLMAENIIKSNISVGVITPLATFLLNAAVVLIVYLGGIRMEQGTGLSGGDVFAIVQYVNLIANSVIMAAFSIVMFPHAQVAAKRIGRVMNAETMTDPIAPTGIKLTGFIEFENVSFRYEGAADPALRNVSFSVKPGEKIAVIGGTGAGKTTLVSLLLGFRMPTQGTLRLDGVSAEQLSRQDMRANMSCCLQAAAIYSGTVRDNLTMGKWDATDEEMWQALAVAQGADFVQAFTEGLDHEIKQSGKNLSGGQKQRLSIARAVLKDAPIFIFDDSFSALDFLTEARLRAALGERIAGKTQLIITQRVSSAMHADRILVMDGGALVGQGSHEELLRTCKVYREIYASQTGGVS